MRLGEQSHLPHRADLVAHAPVLGEPVDPNAPVEAPDVAPVDAAPVFRDANGNELRDGDDVTVVKSLKVKGGGEVKIGTKVRGIRLLGEPVNGHDIDAKVPGHGQIYLKTSVVKKA